MNNFDINKLTIFFFNGGAQIPVGKHHRLVKFFLHYDYNLIAIESPGHGKSRLDRVLNDTEYIDLFYNEFMNIISNLKLKHIGLVGFSLGGLLTLKSIELNIPNIKFVLVYGCGIDVSPEDEKMLDNYTSPEFFVKMRWEPIMKKNHGEGWLNLANTAASIMHKGSNMFSSVQKLDEYGCPIWILIGENDEIFNYNYNRELVKNTKNVSVILVEKTTHFEYTTKYFDYLEIELRRIFSTTNF